MPHLSGGELLGAHAYLPAQTTAYAHSLSQNLEQFSGGTSLFH
jgi:hypothetical protein